MRGPSAKHLSLPNSLPEPGEVLSFSLIQLVGDPENILHPSVITCSFIFLWPATWGLNLSPLRSSHGFKVQFFCYL